ncbi:MAG: hypothetical protein KA791_08295 [Flavobacteriales bacterium]|nr:hypothetical protein [Flavobacteriales bacterium]
MMFYRVSPLFSIAPALISGFFLARWIRRQRPDWARAEDQNGWLILSPHSIRILREPALSCELDKRWSVHVASNHVQGESMHYRDASRNGLGTLTAKGPADHIEVKFLITTNAQQVEFQQVMSAWYRAGIQVTESLGDQRTGILLLRGYRSYADLQRARAQLFGPQDPAR